MCKAGADAFDLTNYIVRWTAYYGDRKIERSTVDGTLYMPVPSNGTVTLSLPSSETRKVPVNAVMRYQFEIISPIGIQHTPLYGDLLGYTEGDNLD